MTKIHLQAPDQAGMTLIELLISITIGLFIIGAALMIFQNTTGIGRQVSEVVQLRQEGMHAFRTIGRQVREAGAIEPEYIIYNNNFRFDPTQWKWIGDTPIAAISLPSGGDAKADTLGISQQVQGSAEYKKLVINCLGQEVTASKRSSNFYVKDGNLMCATGASTVDQPIISNVHGFKVRYRVRPSAANATTKQFVDVPTDWALVDAVEVCLDIVGNSITPTDDAKYTNCEGDSVSRDNRLHVVQRNLFTVFSAQR